MNKYEQIARDIYNDIASGKYEPGSQLALEKEMCAQYGVSRITVKRAVDELVKQGLVVKRRGSGTFVKGVQEEDVENVGMCGQFGGFSNTHQGHQVSTDVKKFEIVHPSPEVAEKLKISTEDFVYDIIRIRYLDGKPENVEYTQMPIEVIPGKIYAADPQSCLFCRHAHRFVDPADGKPYMITCSEALKEDEIKNDEWVYVGMNGACASFEDEEENDEDRIC